MLSRFPGFWFVRYLLLPRSVVSSEHIYGPVFPDLLVFKEWQNATQIFLDVTKVHFNISTPYAKAHCIFLDSFAIGTCRGHYCGSRTLWWTLNSRGYNASSGHSNQLSELQPNVDNACLAN
ncbi:hypothetical protein K443DRAFT_220477 [Laccaria amethystina LaAM-08-1]|uniref:Secreted protein n=1 Tax=Laccaria amethystina LaAM-08-1 TaxID=1095629 RepID=A0A0C9XKK7_9AGAR|nr:hypothetical protein K443DRAFT_220477 [Laccaria amethystina LaAM-08-1]